MTRFLFIRHGESEVKDRLSGRTPDIHLSREGRKEVQALAVLLDSFPFDQLISSPITRTLETAEIIAERFNKVLIIDESFIEVDFGEWTGVSWKDLDRMKTWTNFYKFRSNTRIPGGEIFSEVQDRMVRGVKRLSAEHPDKTLAVVSHGDPIKTLFTYYLGIPLDFILRFTISTASLSILDLDDSRVQVQGLNITRL